MPEIFNIFDVIPEVLRDDARIKVNHAYSQNAKQARLKVSNLRSDAVNRGLLSTIQPQIVRAHYAAAIDNLECFLSVYIPLFMTHAPEKIETLRAHCKEFLKFTPPPFDYGTGMPEVTQGANGLSTAYQNEINVRFEQHLTAFKAESYKAKEAANVADRLDSRSRLKDLVWMGIASVIGALALYGAQRTGYFPWLK
jgi:hypothetical protein